jgi:hypothetical protein
MLAGTLWLPVPKPPIFAHTSAAFAVARNFTNASIAGVSRNVTSRSPPISTAPALAPGVMDGNTAALKPVPGFDFVAEVIAPPTKSASNTIAPFDGVPNAFVTQVGKSVWSEPLEPPARLPVSPRTCPIVFSAFVTDASVHLILWADSALYFAVPYVRR